MLKLHLYIYISTLQVCHNWLYFSSFFLVRRVGSQNTSFQLFKLMFERYCRDGKTSSQKLKFLIEISGWSPTRSTLFPVLDVPNIIGNSSNCSYMSVQKVRFTKRKISSLPFFESGLPAAGYALTFLPSNIRKHIAAACRIRLLYVDNQNLTQRWIDIYIPLLWGPIFASYILKLIRMWYCNIDAKLADSYALIFYDNP